MWHISSPYLLGLGLIFLPDLLFTDGPCALNGRACRLRPCLVPKKIWISAFLFLFDKYYLIID